ncbi:MAG: protein kinase [Acidobacteriaceae bacterium]|nr:protein kinase [Acidobacteriaceae bacterium]
MAPAEWNQVVELFHAALEKSGDQRVLLLDQACGTHTLLRKAVEELLEEYESAGSFLSEPLLDMQPRASCSDVAVPNQRFERFILLEMLGRGGMGEVWSARDTELDRLVALKFLRAETASEVDSVQIAREAKAASALNHPNIVTIHEVVRSEGCSAIVMELVQGSSLAKLRGTSLPIDEVLSIGAQIAKALTAAHANGIIHGDIKPENIILRNDGYVKVLDFGLARRVAIENTAGAQGPIFGTLRYMSPEQARGESLTSASDVFSFGLVLFELAAGRRAFADQSPLTAMQATLTQDAPALISVNPRAPAALSSLVMRMLAKDSAMRPSAAEVAKQLGENLPFSGEQVVGERSRPQPRPGRRFWLATVAISLLVLAAAIWFVFGRRESAQFAELKIQPLTSQAGWEQSPALSPDGQSVAFTWTDKLDGPRQIYVKRLSENDPVKLTSDDSKGPIGDLVWSPDGTRIAFKRANKEFQKSGALYSIPSTGGEEKKLVDVANPNVSSTIDWSPDGTELAFSDDLRGAQRLAIYLFNLRTGKQWKLTSPPAEDWGDWDPEFSPDGRTVVFKRVVEFWADDLYAVPVTGGSPRRVTAEGRGIWGHAWMRDGKSLIVSCQRGGTIFDIWRFPLASKARPERITEGGIDAITPATGRKTNRVAWVNQLWDLNIYRVSTTGVGKPVKLIASTLRDQDATYSPDGRIAFVSDRSGSREIWLAKGDGSGQVRVTNLNGPPVDHLQWSPDGHKLAFDSQLHGHSGIFALECDPASMRCGEPKRLTSGRFREANPNWSADGEYIYFAERMGRWDIWRQPALGGPAVQVTRDDGYASRESPDGKWLYFSNTGTEAIFRLPVSKSGLPIASAKELVVGPPHHVQPEGWTLTRDEVIFIDRATGSQSPAIRAYDPKTQKTRLILPLNELFLDRSDIGLSVSPDSKWILYSQLDRSGSNVMVAESR